jgi:AraC-like DNA-binding protein
MCLSQPDHQSVTINLEYLSHFLAAIGLSNNEVKQRLSSLPIDNTDNLQTRIDIQTAALFLEQAEQELEIESLGLCAGLNMHPSQWGDLGHLMICSRTIMEALNHAIENEDILNSAIETELNIKNSWVEHCVAMPLVKDDELAKPFIERDFTALLQSAGFLLNAPALEATKLKSICFRHKAPESDEQSALYLQAFGLMPTFSASTNTMIYHSDILAAKIPSANVPLQNMLLQQIEQTRQENNISHNLSKRIKTLLQTNSLTRQQTNIANQQEMAQQLGMSISTLKRRLQQEGTSYKNLCNQVRLSSAEKLLLDTNTNLTEISLTLGFASASAFNNAFKKWTGLTPLKYRQQHKNG